MVIFQIDGLDPADEVHTVVANGLGVVTSRINPASLHGLDRNSALRYLSAHQRVLETVMRDYPVLPMKFGTTLSDEGALYDLLRQGDQLLRTTLAAYVGKQQREVVVLWELKHVFEEIAAGEPIATLRAQIAGRSSDETINERIVLGQLVHAVLQQRRAEIAAQVIAHLRESADNLIVNPTMDDSMVVNVALLLDDDREADLDARLDTLDALFDGRFQIRCVGPLPPYSFATLDAHGFSFAEVDAARQLLALAEASSAAEIKRAYRQFAAQAHPDLNPSAEHAAAQMEALNDAYQLLSALAKAQAPTASTEINDWPCHLDRTAVERTLQIAVVGQASVM